MPAPSFDNRYVRLPDSLFARVTPVPVREPRLVQLNEELAGELGLDATWLRSPDGVAMLAGNRMPEGAEPIAQAYAGHQFGSFTTLGDGRAILVGEVIDRQGRHRDLQLKGAGRTPYSRGGDGRASLGPVLRELIVAEAMHALGIPTTRSLAAVVTGEPVFRQTAERGAVLARVASSHVRVGTFEYLAARGDTAGIRALVEFCLQRHPPVVEQTGNPGIDLLRSTMHRQAALIGQWLGVGFIHGVMNTDNTTISGETIDYGPCAFMDTYDPSTVYSSIDRRGRYAYGAQPSIIAWNLARLAEALMPAIDDDAERALKEAQACVDELAGLIQTRWLEVMVQKIGLTRAEEGDSELVVALFAAMHRGSADFTGTFRALCEAAEPAGNASAVRQQFSDPSLFDTWAEAWRARLEREDPSGRAARMRSVNPAFIPRNHQVELALSAAITADDYGPLERLMRVLRRPYDEQPDDRAYAAPPGAEFEAGYQTFCGT